MTTMPPTGTDVLVTCLLNFCDLLNRTVDRPPWEPEKTVADYRPEDVPMVLGVELVASVNGRVLTEFEQACYWVQPGDSLLFKVVPLDTGGGGGKDIIGAVASIALMVAAPGLGGMLGAAIFNSGIGLSVGTSLFLGKAIVGGGFFLASNIISGALASAPPEQSRPALGQTAFKESPTYGWEPRSNPTQNGRPVPIPYGEVHNVVPFLLNQYISTDGDKQYLNMLLALGEGPLDEEDGCTNIKLNDNPVENFDSVETVFRQGTSDQEVIPYFNDTISERAIGTKFDTDWTTVQTAGTALEAVGVGITCPGGLWYANNSGGLDSVSVSIEAEYRAVGDPGWTSWDTWVISGAQRSAIRRYYRLDGLDADQYEVRMRFTVEPESGPRYATDAYFEYIHEISPDDFRLPYTALLAIRALATDQLSGGAPRVTCTTKRSTVDVWDPDAEEWTTEAASNPAWMAYDLVRHPRYGAGVPVADIRHQEFEDAADWCDTKEISGGIYLDSAQDLKSACDAIGLHGRFAVVPRGTQVGVVSDRPVDLPAQGFVASDANVVEFGISWEDDDRADAVEVTYFDPDKGRDTILVLGEFYHSITTRQPRHARLTLYSCQDRDQAVRAGRYLLRCNRYLAEGIELVVKEEAMGCLPGDVIQLAHSIVTGSQPARVASATVSQVVLDREVTLEEGETYQLRVSHTNRQHPTTGRELVEIVAITAVGADTTTDTIALAENLDYAPAADAVVSIDNTEVSTQYYTILTMRRTQKGRIRLEALEYHSEIYADEGEVPEVSLPDTLAGIVGLTAGIFDRTEDGVAKRVIGLSWRGASIWWRVWYRRLGGGSWTRLGETSVPYFDARNLETGAVYEFAVSPTPALNDAETVNVDFTEGVTGVLGNVQEYNVSDELEVVTEYVGDDLIPLQEVA